MPIEVEAPDGSVVEFPDGTDDATMARAMQQTYGAPKRSTPPRTPIPRKQSGWDAATGFMANVNRGLGIGDEIAGGVRGVFRAGEAIGRGRLDQIPRAFQSGMADQRAREDQFQANSPRMAALARGIGNAGTAPIPAGPTAALLAAGSRVGNMVRGATTAGLFGAGFAAADRGTMGERLTAASQTAMNPLVLGLGAAGGALAPAAQSNSRNVQTPHQRNIEALDQAGVFVTPGARAGGAVKAAEDLGRRAPILGGAIKGAADRGVVGLNRAVAIRALSPIGEPLPAKIHPGHDTVKHVAKRLGATYDAAADLVPVAALDEPFTMAADGIAARLTEQPAGVMDQFKSIVTNRLSHLVGKEVTGRQIRDAQSTMSRLASEYSSSADGGQRALGGALDDLADELANIIGRQSPEAADMIERANSGYAVYTRMRNAASKAKGGIYSPGQLNIAVRAMDRSVGKGNMAKGEALLQDLSNAAWEVMPDTYGNPGTADALSAMGLAAGVVSPVTAPVAIPSAMALGAAATPYLMMGRKVIESLPDGATPAQLAQAQRQLQAMVAQDPAVAPLLREVSARLSRASGAAGGTSRVPTVEAYAPDVPGAYGASYGPAGQ